MNDTNMAEYVWRERERETETNTEERDERFMDIITLNKEKNIMGISVIISYCSYRKWCPGEFGS